MDERLNAGPPHMLRLEKLEINVFIDLQINNLGQ